MPKGARCKARNGCHIDDAAMPALQHAGQRQSAQMGISCDHDLDEVTVGGPVIVHKMIVHAVAGIIDEHINLKTR